ncbi:hypothetical protein D9M68_1004190 [compost metagenome]
MRIARMHLCVKIEKDNRGENADQQKLIYRKSFYIALHLYFPDEIHQHRYKEHKHRSAEGHESVRVIA